MKIVDRLYRMKNSLNAAPVIFTYYKGSNMTRFAFFRTLFLASPLAFFMAEPVRAFDLENTLYLDLKDGRVVIELLPDLAPMHVARIKELVRAGFYDGVVFHRVMAGFMAQTGDPTGTGRGGSGQNLKAEFSSASHLRGTVSMARSHHPDSADSQFFIVFERAAHLDGQYTVWGQVTEGMPFVDSINKVSLAGDGIIDVPDKIIRLQVAEDAIGN